MSLEAVQHVLPQRFHSREHLTFASILGALTYALDLTEGAQPGHALRTCLLGMRIGEELRLTQQQLSDLYYALLLKDVGCSSNATRLHQIVGGDEIRAKAFTKTNDWTRYEWRQIQFLLFNVHAGGRLGNRLRAMGRLVKNSSQNAEMLIRLRCHQGAAVIKDLGLGQNVADAIYNLDEHWNGAGYPDHIAGEDIPLLSRVVSLAQTLEVFHQQYGPAAAIDCIKRRSGRWFDPRVVRAVLSLQRRGGLWTHLAEPDLAFLIAQMEPMSLQLPAEDAVIDNICTAFAGVVDAKSHSTYMHSTGVARIAEKLGSVLGLTEEELVTLRRAALLHDIGKLSVPNSILDKPGKLDSAEWACVQQHPRFTYEILVRIPTFQRIAELAAAHHEKLDGTGYYRGLRGEQLDRSARILAIADMFEALSADRPYRAMLSHEQVLGILRRDVPHALDPDCFQALERMTGQRQADLTKPVRSANDVVAAGIAMLPV